MPPQYISSCIRYCRALQLNVRSVSGSLPRGVFTYISKYQRGSGVIQTPAGEFSSGFPPHLVTEQHHAAIADSLRVQLAIMHLI